MLESGGDIVFLRDGGESVLLLFWHGTLEFDYFIAGGCLWDAFAEMGNRSAIAHTGDR